jgi:2-oxoisovalerate dehydrogenase E2 component (dihydrolipoyl transacylase)
MRLAQERGIDLETVEGTGIGGRITKHDVLSAAQTALASRGGDQLTEPSPIRKIIAANMVRSWTEIPHAWSTVETDVTDLVELRESQKDGFRQRHAVPLSYLAFSVNAIAGALRSNPLVNSSWEDGRMRVKTAVNVGIAVAAPDGLVVPVVPDADRMSVGELARAIAPLVERARDGKLALEDVRGGTFTVNNTGALGSVWGGAIINYPQAAIINTESIVKRPMVIETPDGESVAIRSVMNLCLSFDHRVLDGAEASAFIQDVKRRLEQFGPDTELE